MSLMNFFKKFSIIIFVILALIVSRMGIGYLTILILIGLIVSFINQRKREAIITGILYALVSYILSYPAGLFLSEYMPSTTLDVSANTMTVMTDLIIGALIPIIVSVIICGICAVIGSEISKYVLEAEKESDKSGYHFNNENVDLEGRLSDNYKDSDYIDINDSYDEEFDDKDLLNLTPIQKAKIRRERQKNKGR